MNKKRNYILILILIAALGIRICGIWFGLPERYHEDEIHEVLRALQLGAGSFNFDRVTKGGYFFLLFIEYAIYFVFLKIAGLIHTAMDFAHMYIRDPSMFYLIGRATTALIGTINVAVTYLIGKEAHSKKVGLYAALFMCFNYLHAHHSHYITVDIPMTCLVTISLLYATRISSTIKISHYAWCGFYTGLAIITKFPAIILLIPITIAHISSTNAAKLKFKGTFFGKEPLIFCLILISVIIAGAPGIIREFPNIFARITSAASGAQVSEASVNIPPFYLFKFYLSSLNLAMGAPLLALSCIGMIYAIYHRNKKIIILASFAIPFFLALSLIKNTELIYARYIMPILPAMAIFAAVAFYEILSRLPLKKTAIAAFAIGAIFIIDPGYKIIRKDYQLCQADTRTLAKQWVENNIPAGTKILIEGHSTKVIESTIPLRNCRKNIINSIKAFEENEPGKAMYLRLELKVLPKITYDLVFIGESSSVSALSHYKQIGIKYFVLRANAYAKSTKEKYQDMPDFISRLKKDPDIILVQSFRSDDWTMPGPDIDIYKLREPY